MKKVLFVFGIAILTLSCTDNSQKTDHLNWLKGNWSRVYNGNTQIERWDAQGDDLLGISSFANGKDTTDMVTFQIQKKGDIYVLITKDIDFEQEVIYDLKSANADSFLFENTGNEWPQTIKYKQIENKTLIKTVSGQQGSMKKEIELTFQKTQN